MASQIVLVGLALALQPFESAGDVVSARDLGTLSAQQVSQKAREAFRGIRPLPQINRGVRLLSVIYRTTQTDGTLGIASGLVAIPTGESIGTVLYCHGTTAERSNVPSNARIGSKSSVETQMAVLAFSGGGYLTVANDYLGLGVNKGVHPYCQSINADSGRDLIIASREIERRLNRKTGLYLHVTGYSEGGLIAAWTARKLWQGNDTSLYPSSAAPLSGPYDLSRTMAKLVGQSKVPFGELAARFFFLSYFFYGLEQNGNQVDLENVFVPSFASYIPTAFGRGGSDGQLALRMANKAVQLGAVGSMKRVFQPKAYQALTTTDRTAPIIQRMSKHDCIYWSPYNPVYLVALKQDSTVPAKNTEVAKWSMRSSGVGPVRLRSYIANRPGSDHVKFNNEAIILARRFFEGGFSAVPVDRN